MFNIYQKVILKPLYRIIVTTICCIVILIFAPNSLQANIINKPIERQNIVYNLHKTLDSDDYKRAAFLNATLAQEALQRSYNTLKAWENLRNSHNGLLPRDLTKNKNLWLPKDNAADLYPFLFIAGKLLDPENEKLWLNTLEKEREICGPMP